MKRHICGVFCVYDEPKCRVVFVQRFAFGECTSCSRLQDQVKYSCEAARGILKSQEVQIIFENEK